MVKNVGTAIPVIVQIILYTPYEEGLQCITTINMVQITLRLDMVVDVFLSIIITKIEIRK